MIKTFANGDKVRVRILNKPSGARITDWKGRISGKGWVDRENTVPGYWVDFPPKRSGGIGKTMCVPPDDIFLDVPDSVGEQP